MLKSEILSECARRVGDEDPGFIANHLSKAFNFVLLELAQDDCLSLTRKVASFPFNHAACTASGNLLNINTAALLTAVLSTPAGTLPDTVEKLLVPSWGASVGTLMKLSDPDFEARWMGGGNNPGKPSVWRIYPNLTQVQLYPAPDTASLTASCQMTVTLPPTALNDSDTISEILASDVVTILAGLYTYGILWRDDVFNDQAKAQALWQQGKVTMRERKLRAHHYGRRNQIAFREF